MENEYYDWPWKPMDIIPVDRELNALLRLNSEFPLAIAHDNLSEYKNGFVNWHKQGSIEISVITEGSVIVNLLNYQEEVKAGEGFLIFPGVLHSIRSAAPDKTAKYETIILESRLLTGFGGSYFEKNYYKPEIVNRIGYFHFSMEESSLQECIPELKTIFTDTYWEDAFLKNQIQYKLQKVWIALWKNIMAAEERQFNKGEDVRLFRMIDFLQKNHQKNFELDELCGYMGLSRSACCRYFKKMMNMSILDYLLEYRMSQALYLLDNTDMSITDIASYAGFSTTSYFIARFKEKMNMTPRKYKIR